MIELALAFVAGLIWDMWRRYLASRESLAGVRVSQEHHILARLEKLSDAFQDVSERVDGSVEKHRAIMQGFVNSMSDIVKLSEEEKSNLKNRLAAAKLK